MIEYRMSVFNMTDAVAANKTGAVEQKVHNENGTNGEHQELKRS
jgi:hypothetical protein